MNAVEDVDVLIVGSGPAGTSTALHLVHKNPVWAGRILVVDKAVHPRHKLCGGAITHLGQNVLSRLGCDIEPRSVPVREVRLVYRDLAYSFRGDPVFRIVHRAEFDYWLVRKAEERGVVVHQGEGVTDVVVHDDHVLVTTENRQIRARALVAADGSLSLIRHKLNWHDRPGLRARLVDVETPLGPAEQPDSREGVAIFDFLHVTEDLQGYYWDFPRYVSGQPVMSRGVFDSRVLPKRPRAKLKKVLRTALHARSLNLDDYKLKGHPIRTYHPAIAVSRPRVLLAGDAAGVDPLFGEGISLALAYGDVASDALIDAFSRSDFSFADYQRRLHRHWLLWQLPWRTRLARAAYFLNHPLIVRLGWHIARTVIRLTPWRKPDYVPAEPVRLTVSRPRGEARGVQELAVGKVEVRRIGGHGTGLTDRQEEILELSDPLRNPEDTE